MAYDEDLAGRVREVMPPDAEVTERKMFGGLAFLLRGHMFAGIVGSELMVRIGSEAAQRALELDHVREMDFTGRPMKNMIFVQPAGLRGPALERWITAAADHARTLARKQPKRPRRRAHGKSGEIAIPGAGDQVGWWVRK
jgi:TfoX/Sxy family transcriptional regulator of competence genes